MVALRLKIITLLFISYTTTSFAQCNYEKTFIDNNGVTIVVSVYPIDIKVNSANCQWGYNFDVKFKYNITATKNGIPINNYSFYTLQGNFSTNKGNLFFDLPNQTGSGTSASNGNAWNGDGKASCSSITLADINISYTEVQIESSAISNQTVKLDCNTPLPVELVYFTSKVNLKNIELNWATASEHKNSYFLIEKSYDGYEWQILNKVNGSGNSTSKKNYSLIDNSPNVGKNYYRITQFDFNGDFKVYNIISASFYPQTTTVVYPNPVSDYLTISKSGVENEILLYTAQGILIQNLDISYLNNSTILINFKELPKGLYIISINAYKQKIIKE